MRQGLGGGREDWMAHEEPTVTISWRDRQGYAQVPACGTIHDRIIHLQC